MQSLAAGLLQPALDTSISNSTKHQKEPSGLIDGGSLAAASEHAKPYKTGGHGFAVSESASYSSYLSQSNQASLDITTRDGDKISIRYSSLIQSSSSEQYASSRSANQLQQSYQSSQSLSSSVSFQISVQGDLDEAELSAINNVMDELGEIASQFFDGDVQSAFNAALELGFDSEQLSSLTLDLQQNTRAEVVQTYQSTEQLIDQAQPRTVSSGPAPAIDVLAQLDQLIEQAQERTSLQEPEQTLKDLLKALLEDAAESSGQAFDQIIELAGLNELT